MIAAFHVNGRYI